MSKVSEQQKQAELRRKSNEVIGSLPDCAKIYFRNLRTQNKSERTIYQYAFDMKGFFDFIQESAAFKNSKIEGWKIGDILDKLNKEDLQEYVESISTYEINEPSITGVKKREVVSSPAYVSRKISSLRSFYQYFFECGDISKNTPTLIKNPKLKNKNINVLDNSDIKRYMEAIESEKNMTSKQKAFHKRLVKRDKTIIMLLLTTGMRISELVGIDLADIDFNDASIKIIRKGGNEDEIYFNDEVEALLKDYIETDRKTLLNKAECPALFVSQQKDRLKVRNIETMISNYALKAGLNKKITPHMFRRTFGTYLYGETEDIYLVAQQLGHRSVDTTIRHYAKMNKERKRQAAEIAKNISK